MGCLIGKIDDYMETYDHEARNDHKCNSKIREKVSCNMTTRDISVFIKIGKRDILFLAVWHSRILLQLCVLFIIAKSKQIVFNHNCHEVFEAKSEESLRNTRKACERFHHYIDRPHWEDIDGIPNQQVLDSVPEKTE